MTKRIAGGWAKTVVAGALALAAWSAAAQQCVGFGDLLDDGAGGFCPTVEWVKNRGITTGCGDGSNYCPTAAVSRLAMAAFMQRLGKALTPELHFVEGGTGAITVPDNPPVPLRCMTGSVSAAGYPRSAVVNATFTGLADGNAIAYRGFLLYSDDDGATWQGAPTQVGHRAQSAAGEWSGLALTTVFTLDPDPLKLYKFAIGFRRDDQVAGTTGNFAQGRCQLAAQVVNRNGAASPL